MHSDDRPGSNTPSPHVEAGLVLAFTLVGAVLRLRGFGRLGLTHFDEGVYAIAGLWAVGPRGLAGLDPQVIAYAPPGFPILVGLIYQVLGVSDASPLLASAACGILTIPVCAWVGRRTFGRGAGAASSAFAALALAHVAFSRKALTDAPFLLAWVSALGLGGRFLERPTAARAVVLGVAVGVAQNFKYNGYLAGVVVALAAAAGLLSNPEARRLSALARTFGVGLLAAAVSALVYWPWFRFVEVHGGYADLLRHHRSYLGGPGSWLPNARLQLAQAVALSGGAGWGALTWSTAWIAAALAVNGPALVGTPGRWDWSRFRLGLLVGAVAMLAAPDLGWWAGLAWAGWLVFDPRPAPRVLGSAWLVLSVLTPFYHPYARLWLPLHAAGWFLLSGAVVRLGPFSRTVLSEPDWPSWSRPRVRVRAALAVACILAARLHWWGDTPRSFPLSAFAGPTDHLRRVVDTLIDVSPMPVGQGATLRTYARRPVAFYLALRGPVPFRLLASPEDIYAGPGATGDWLLVDEVLLGEEHFGTAKWPRVAAQWYQNFSAPIELDPVTLLDVNPHAPFENGPFDPRDLVLFAPRTFGRAQVRPGTGPGAGGR